MAATDAESRSLAALALRLRGDAFDDDQAVYYDVHARPVSIFAGDKSHGLFVVDEDDDELIGIEGGPHVTAALVSPPTD